MAAGSDRVVQITFTDHTLVVRLADGCLLTVPLAWFPRLLQAPDDARGNWHVADGAILWPEIGEALDIASLLKRGQERG